MAYDKRHGGPYDRGSADSYYSHGRCRSPHYYDGPGMSGKLVKAEDMTPEEIAAYNAGFEDNTRDGNFKDLGGK